MAKNVTLLLFGLLGSIAFPLRASLYEVNEYGATGDGVADDTEAIQSTIDAAYEAGGGHVLVTPGDYVVGPLHLKSNITFEIQAGATLWCTENIGAFYRIGRELTSREISDWKGLHTDFQMINGDGLKNVSIVGKGTINGRGSSQWWGKQKIRPYVIRIRDSEKVSFEDVTVRESPFHSFNFSNTEGLLVRGVVLRNDPRSPNTDGLHVFNCRRVRIAQVDFDTGDDCLLTPGSEDVVVTNSRFRTTWGVWWPSRECRRISITNCVVDCQMLIKDFRHAEDVVISGIVATGPGRLFSSYGGPLKNVLISDVIANGWSQGGWFINGENITLDNVHIIRQPGSGNDFLKNGFSFKDVRGLALRNVSIENVESGSALYCENVADLEVAGFQSTGVPDTEPVISLSNVSTVRLHGNQGTPGSVFARIEGLDSNDIRYVGNDLNGARIEIDDGILKDSVQQAKAVVVSFDAPRSLVADEAFSVKARVASDDVFAGAFPLALLIDNEIVSNKWVWMEPGEEREIELKGPPMYVAKRYEIGVVNLPAKRVWLEGRPARLAVRDVKLDLWDRIIPIGKEVSIKATVQNAGSNAASLPVSLKDGDAISHEKLLKLEPGEQADVSFAFSSSSAGSRQLFINDQWSSYLKVYDGAEDSIFLHYDFNSLEDDKLVDSSGLGFHGMAKSNEGGAPPRLKAGVAGQALQFNGESAFAETPRMLFSFPMTISLWAQAGSLTPSSTAGRQMILYASEPMGNDGYGPEPEIHFMRAAGDTFTFWTNEGARRLDLRYPIGSESDWQHIVVVYDEESRMYIDGKEVSVQQGIRSPMTESYADRIYIGRPNVDYLRYFNGALDELTFFREALNSEQVEKLYQSYHPNQR